MMRNLFVCLAAAILVSCSTTKQSTMQSSDSNSAAGDGWISLFDGKTTAGWHTYNKTGIGNAWKVEDGTLHLDASAKKTQSATGGDIVTDEEFENFHLKYDWKISPNGNSGVIFYSKEDPQYSAMWHTGPEMQVLDNNGHPDAKITKHRSGDLYDLITSKEAVKPVGEWNTAEIVANNGKLEFYLNGQQTLSTTMWDDNWRNMIAASKFKDMPAFGTIKKGRIGLQDHGDDVWFRNIQIKRL
jgi:hypothetical protein